MYLRAWNTQQSIADAVDVDQSVVSRTIDNFMQNGQMSELHKTFKPFLYNIWNHKEQDEDTSHFGAFPAIFMENLLHYHTKPFDAGKRTSLFVE